MDTASASPLVFIHPTWPWKAPVRSPYDRRRLARYRRIIEAAIAHKGSVLLIESAPVELPSDVAVTVKRLQKRAVFRVTDSENTTATLRDASKSANRYIVSHFASGPVILGGFYRNLCVQYALTFFDEATIDNRLSPAHYVF